MPASSATVAPLPVRSRIQQRLGQVLPALNLAASRGLAMFAQVAVQIAVGALSGPVGLGVLQLFSAWSNILGEVLARGWPMMVLKRVSVAWDRGDPESGRMAVKGASRSIVRGWPVAVAASIALVIAGRFFAFSTTFAQGALLALALLISAISFALLRVRSEALKGADVPLTAVVLENMVLPAVLLLVCGFCFVFGFELSSMLLVLGCVLGVIAGSVWLGRAMHRRIGYSDQPLSALESPVDQSERRALWLSSVQAIAFLQLPFLVMPAFTDISTIGIYAVAHKLINVITTLLILLGSIYGPAFARAAANGDRIRLLVLLRRTQWVSLAIFAPASALFVLLSADIAVLFHVPGSELHEFMLILVLGQMVNAATGLSGILLNMTGSARIEWRISLASLCVALLLTLPVGNEFGATGLAILFSFVIAVKNIASWLAARKHLSSGVIPNESA